MDILIMIGVGLAVLGLVVLSIWAMKKFKIQKEDLLFGQIILDIIDKLNTRYDWRYSGELALVVELVAVAYGIALQTEGLTDKTKIINFVFLKTEELCIIYGFTFDKDLSDLVRKLIEIVVA